MLCVSVPNPQASRKYRLRDFTNLSGTIGITYAHELMHQKSRLERRAGDALMAMVLYGHFRSEHLLVHHRHVATPKDPVTARSGESFWAFFPRVLWQCLVSSWRAEADTLARTHSDSSKRITTR